MITVMFWNVWFENQINDSRLSVLEEALEDFVLEHSPDVIGLNEVVKFTEKNHIPLHKKMSELGYNHAHFAQTNRITDKFTIGSTIYSKTELKDTDTIYLGRNATAKRKGYDDFRVSAVVGSVELSGKPFQIISAHPINIKPSTLKNHYQHTRKLGSHDRVLNSAVPTVIGGDMNEPRLFPFSVRSKLRQDFNHRTGSFINPSWRYRGQTTTILRANLDRLFWSKNHKLIQKSFYIIDTNVSDHRPIISTFEIE
jgi:endonuclease/exonuclease/phosphatase family metal-dependent hydrolase